MAGLFGTDHQLKDHKDYRRYGRSAEPGEGKRGVSPMNAQQIADKKSRDAAKTPMNQPKYS